MDLFSSPPPSFQDDLNNGEILLWDFPAEPFNLAEFISDLLPPEPAPAVVSNSAFTSYVLTEGIRFQSGNSGRNIHHRVIELVRKIPRAQPDNRAREYSRGFHHMMRERQRREKLSQSYADLHLMLPYRSKPDKNSIVQSAAAYVRELKGMEEDLVRRNEELKMRATRKSTAISEGAKIKIRVANPTSSLDSMIGALRCLKVMEVKARAIQTEFSGNELTTVMSIESKVGASEMEKAVEGALINSCR